MPLAHYLLMLVGTLLPAAVLSWLGCWGARRWAPRLGWVDRPDARKTHPNATPLGGGLAMVAAVLAPFAIGSLVVWRSQADPQWATTLPTFVQPFLPGIAYRLGALWILLAAGGALALLGWLDDWRGVDWRWRLLTQFAIAGTCVACVPALRLTAFVPLPWLTSGLSVLWIVALVNAFNMLDNMDGLSAGVAALVGAFLVAVLLTAPNPESPHPQLFVAGWTLVVVGSTLGFLAHNHAPARLFMGDAGSYFLGFALATATLLATYCPWQSEGRHAIFAPLFLMAVPWYDLLSVVIIRLRAGRSPFAADRNHFSHRLVDLGFSRFGAVQVIYLVTAISGLAALLLHRVDGRGAWLLGAILLCVFALVALLESTARRKLK